MQWLRPLANLASGMKKIQLEIIISNSIGFWGFRPGLCIPDGTRKVENWVNATDGIGKGEYVLFRDYCLKYSLIVGIILGLKCIPSYCMYAAKLLNKFQKPFRYIWSGYLGIWGPMS